MDIPNPRRILLVGAPDAPILDLLQDLTGTKPTLSPNEPSLAGSSHALPLKTAYYTATIPIWIDVPAAPPPGTDSPSAATASYATWAQSFLSTSLPGASDVLTALGAFVVCFRKPSSAADFDGIKALLSAVARVVEGCKRVSEKEGKGEWDGVCLAVALRRAVVPGLEVQGEEWEDVCMEGGFEFVDGEVGGIAGNERNEFGELTGIARLKEALEANDWASIEDDFGLDDFGDLEDEDSMGFGTETAELEMEMFGMKRAIYGEGEGDEDEDEEGEGEAKDARDREEDEEDEVEKLEALMLRMQAVRDMGADLPDAERKRFAAKAVKDIMKTL